MEMWKEEHDACGIGAVINIDGTPDNQVLGDALTIVEKLEHRAGTRALYPERCFRAARSVCTPQGSQQPDGDAAHLP